MNPATFDYVRAGSVQEAIALLQQYGDGAKVLAGGHSLLPVMKLRLAEPATLVDIGRLAEMRGIAAADGTVRIGALTTSHELTRDPIVREMVPLLAEAADRVGDRQVRNRGTLGGALAHADAAADYPAVVLALGARVVARGPNGEREIAADDFFVDFLTTALAPDELLVEVRFPTPASRSGASYQKLANQASGYAVVGVAATVTLDDAGRCAAVGIGITGTAAVARRAAASEAALLESDLSDDAIAGAADLAAEMLQPLDDIHASAAYRLRVTQGLTRRALQTAIARAREA